MNKKGRKKEGKMIICVETESRCIQEREERTTKVQEGREEMSRKG